MLNQRKNDERRSLEAAQLSLLNKTIETQAARIKELESHVVTDNNETLANALEKIKELESLLAEAGDELLAFICGCDFALNGWDISKAKLIVSKIDAILPKNEEVK